jgi:hypothetical protein
MSTSPLAVQQAVRRAVAHHLIRNLRATAAETKESVFKEIGVSISHEEALEYMTGMRRMLLQPAWFHHLLLEKPRDPESDEALIQRIRHQSDNKYSTDSLRVRVALWRRFCIEPLRAGDASVCVLREVTNQGTTSKAFILTPASMNFALQWLSNLSWIPTEKILSS